MNKVFDCQVDQDIDVMQWLCCTALLSGTEVLSFSFGNG